jgi:hypothetical protein
MRKVEDDVGNVLRNEVESSKSEVGNRESQSRIFESRELISTRRPPLYPDRSLTIKEFRISGTALLSRPSFATHYSHHSIEPQFLRKTEYHPRTPQTL